MSCAGSRPGRTHRFNTTEENKAPHPGRPGRGRQRNRRLKVHPLILCSLRPGMGDTGQVENRINTYQQGTIEVAGR